MRAIRHDLMASYIAPIDTDQHLAFGSPPEHAVRCRRFDRYAWQFGGGRDQSFEREIDAGRDDSAQIGAVGPDMVERRRGAEADDELVLAGLDRLRRDCVDRAVGADRLRLVDL